jgi:D-alanyl-D-alanine carboxypeptidase
MLIHGMNVEGEKHGPFRLVAIPLRGIWFAAVLMLGTNAVSADPVSEALDQLVAAYPAALERHDGASIFWRDGMVMPATDGVKDKSFDQLLKQPSILDQFALPYATGRLTAPPPVNIDPGRFRNEAFFRKLYGDCRKGDVERNLVAITWLPKTWGKVVRVTRAQGVAERLKDVSAEIDALPASVSSAAYPIAGVLACRPVADTGRMSMHGYAAAIDLNLQFSDYWLWQKKADPISYRNRMPQEIVDIFERHGFIWGGKWYHYDTMHFEYRPELIGFKPSSQ